MENRHLTVKELIEVLELESNKDKPIYFYLVGKTNLLPLRTYNIDFDIDDRLDFNVHEI